MIEWVFVESKDEEVVPSMDTQESSARPSRSFRPLVPQDEEEDDVVDMDDVGDDNLVETDDVSSIIETSLSRCCYLILTNTSLHSYEFILEMHAVNHGIDLNRARYSRTLLLMNLKTIIF